MSSRLLSTANANGFAIIPSAATPYICNGKTKIVLFGDVSAINPEGLQEMLKLKSYKIDETNPHLDCKCGHAVTSPITATHSPSQVVNKTAEFGVFCLTISDRASKGEYPEDLSGKAMVECVAGHERF